MAISEKNLLESKFTKLNNIIGWCVFFIAVFVYWATVEPTASFWDCSENLSIYYKLEVGHPPGEPFLQLLQHCISLLSFGDVHKVAPIVNRACATFSALSILFLFWIITFFGKKLYSRYGELTEGRMYAILGAGFIGATSFIFADSLWFSATEASVWAMSACFTALMFWCSTKYARATDHSERWLILLSLLIGLAVGVHFLCLLFIPAAVLLYFIKNYPPEEGLRSKRLTNLLSIITKDKRKQVGIAGFFTGVLVLGGVKSIVIPGIIGLASWFELFFVNNFGLPFNSGALIYGLVLVVLITWGLKYTKAKNKPGWNTAILCAATLIIGYCIFILLVVRANAFTPMNEDNPSDPMSLNDYLDRKQYGSWPQLYGPYYTASPISSVDGSSVYAKDEKKGKYIEITKTEIPKYDPAMCTVFPRMYDPSQGRPRGYKNWGGVDMVKVKTMGQDGPTYEECPTFGDNVTYFWRYQIKFMFLRYFMWDFCGRQNDFAGEDPADNLHGNWITGISAIDNMRAPQEGMPDELANNKARNAMYGLPLILGLLGMGFHFFKDKRNALVVTTLFFFTGLAIILYLNQPPYQPRERDYSYVNSFFAFAIWIGLGVLALFELFTKWSKSKKANKGMAVAATIAALIVPVVMAHAEWDDHDRSGRYTCRDLAIDYLQSCPPNAILFTDGDCDTFPLWYAQEVEGIRTDVRVCNLELMGMAWYVDQMNRKAYQSDRMPFSLTHDEYREGTRDYLYIAPNNPNYKSDSYYDLKGIIDFIKSDDENKMIQLGDGKEHNYFPTPNFSLKVDKEAVLKNGIVSAAMADSIVPELDWKIRGTLLERNKIMVLDAIAHNNWKRPICFTTTLPQDNYMGLEKYFQTEGLVYQLVPILNTRSNSVEGRRIASNIMYDNVMHKFRWGNMGSGIYLDENIRRMATDLRLQSTLLATELIRENKKDSAIKVLDLVTDSISVKSSPYDYFETLVVQNYYDANAYKKANAIAKELFNKYEIWVKYFKSLDPENQKYYNNMIEEDLQVLENLAYLSQAAKQTDIANDFQARLEALHQQGVM